MEQGADCLHMVQLMPLPLTVSCFNKIQMGFTYLIPADLGSPGKRAVKRVCVCCQLTIYPFSARTVSLAFLHYKFHSAQPKSFTAESTFEDFPRASLALHRL